MGATGGTQIRQVYPDFANDSLMTSTAEADS
jgi:hypothetical protein